MLIRPSTARALAQPDLRDELARLARSLADAQRLEVLGPSGPGDLEGRRKAVLAAARRLDKQYTQQLGNRPEWWVQLVLLVALGAGFVFTVVFAAVQQALTSWWALTGMIAVPPGVVVVLNRLRRLGEERVALGMRVRKYEPRIVAALSLPALEAIAREMAAEFDLLTGPKNGPDEPAPPAQPPA